MATPEYDGVVTADLDESAEDKRLLVHFYKEAIKNEFKSAQEGRPIFDEITMVKIITPGSRDVMVNVASERYQERFPRQWERFLKGQEQVVDGTPIAQVPFLTVGQVAELRAVNCHTLEHLASMSDQQASKMMGMHSVRQKAKDYLEAAKSAAPLTRLQAALEERDNKIAVLQETVNKLSAALDKLQAKA